MQVIYKYRLNLDEAQTIGIPFGAKILKVAQQRESIHVWALVNTDNKEVPFNFRIVGTGHEIEDLKNFRHLDTVLMTDGLVWHVFLEETT